MFYSNYYWFSCRHCNRRTLSASPVRLVCSVTGAYTPPVFLSRYTPFQSRAANIHCYRQMRSICNVTDTSGQYALLQAHAVNMHCYRHMRPICTVTGTCGQYALLEAHAVNMHCYGHIFSASLLTTGITLGTNRAGVWGAFLVRVREVHIPARNPPVFLHEAFSLFSLKRNNTIVPQIRIRYPYRPRFII